MTWTVVGRVVAGVAVASAAVACSGSDTDETVTSSTLTAPATTTPPTTVVETSTTEASTTLAPTTTLDEEAATIVAIEQAYFEAFEAYHEAIFDPSNDELRAGLEDFYVAQGLENVISIMDDLVALNAVARENPDFGPARTQIIGPVQFENDEHTEATLVVCQLNAEWFVEPESGPNGEDSILRQDVVRVDLVVRMALDDGAWKSKSGGNSRELVGVETCDD